MRIRAGAKAIRKGVMTRRRNKARYVEHLLRATLDLPHPHWWLWNPARPTWVEVVHASLGNNHLMLLF